MSNLETILTRAMNDASFADALMADPEKATAEYDLSPEELASLKSMSRIEVDEKSSSASPEERKSFAMMAYMALKGKKSGPFKGEGSH